MQQQNNGIEAGAYSLFEGSCSPKPSFCAANCDRGWQFCTDPALMQMKQHARYINRQESRALGLIPKALEQTSHTVLEGKPSMLSEECAISKQRSHIEHHVDVGQLLCLSPATFDSQGGPPRKAITCRCRMAFNQNSQVFGFVASFHSLLTTTSMETTCKMYWSCFAARMSMKIAHLLFFFFCLETSNLAHQAPWMSSMMSYLEHVWWLWIRLINYRWLMMAWSRWHPVQFFGCLRCFHITIYKNGTKRDSTTTFSRFQNQNHAIPEPNHAIPQPKPARFHNYILTIPQPHSHDSTTKISGFHNQTLRIPHQTLRNPQPNSHDSTTTLSRFTRHSVIPHPRKTIDQT